jgi:hypothetical protein
VSATPGRFDGGDIDLEQKSLGVLERGAAVQARARAARHCELDRQEVFLLVILVLLELGQRCAFRLRGLRVNRSCPLITPEDARSSSWAEPARHQRSQRDLQPFAARPLTPS